MLFRSKLANEGDVVRITGIWEHHCDGVFPANGLVSSPRVSPLPHRSAVVPILARAEPSIHEVQLSDNESHIGPAHVATWPSRRRWGTPYQVYVEPEHSSSTGPLPESFMPSCVVVSCDNQHQRDAIDDDSEATRKTYEASIDEEDFTNSALTSIDFWGATRKACEISDDEDDFANAALPSIDVWGATRKAVEVPVDEDDCTSASVLSVEKSGQPGKHARYRMTRRAT